MTGKSFCYSGSTLRASIQGLDALHKQKSKVNPALLPGRTQALGYKNLIEYVLTIKS